ncbi:MAG: hypothetical protein J7L55_00900 [Desulfurococcales archaeon]|nr:hypothetical protein [Desulfurococcales archaeon]
MSNVDVCTSCRRRHAFYVRHASGEKLCRKCLEKSLLKHIRRSLRGIGLRPRTVISVYLPRSWVLEGLLLLRLVSNIERNYGTHVLCFVPINCAGTVQSFISGLSNVSLIPYRKDELSFPSCMLNSTLHAEELARSFEPFPQAVLLPYSLTDLNEGFLEALLVKQEALSTMKKLYTYGIPWVVLPFKDLPRRDLYALAYTNELIEALNSCPPTSGPTPEISEIVHEMTIYHSELTYRMENSITALMKFRVSTPTKD